MDSSLNTIFGFINVKFILLILATTCFIYLFIKQGWRIQKAFGSMISLYTPKDNFSLSVNMNQQEFDGIIKKGFAFAKTKSIVITSLVRNVEERMSDIIIKVESLGNMFKKYKVLIVENDSTDNTRQLLLDWKNRNNNVTILGCGYNATSCTMKLPPTSDHSVSTSRIQKMADLRNILLEEIKKNYNDYNYVAMWDLDIYGSLYLDGVATTFCHFQENKDVDVISAFGLNVLFPGKYIYYDTYAHVEKGGSFELSKKTEHDIKIGSLGMKYTYGDKPIEVDSAFGGMTFYTMSGLKDAYYDMTPDNPTGNIECEHVRLHRRIPGKKMMNPSMIHIVLKN